MKGSLTRARWAAIGAAVAVSLGGGVVLVAHAGGPTATDVGFKAIRPCRLLDTRTTVTSQINPTGIQYGKIGNQTNTPLSATPNDLSVIFDSRAMQPTVMTAVTGYENSYKIPGIAAYRPLLGDCDASFGSGDINPTDTITAVVLNVTVVDNSQGSFVTLYPWQLLDTPGITELSSSGGTAISFLPRPLTSNLNPIGGLSSVTNQVTVNLAQLEPYWLGTTYVPATLPNVRCDDGGDYGVSDCAGYLGFRVYNNLGTANLIIDVMGYFYEENVVL